MLSMRLIVAVRRSALPFAKQSKSKTSNSETSKLKARLDDANARASTGPKTRAGKARSARNALRHGLNIRVWSDPALAPEAEAIALVIAGPNADAETLDYARQISATISSGL